MFLMLLLLLSPGHCCRKPTAQRGAGASRRSACRGFANGSSPTFAEVCFRCGVARFDARGDRLAVPKGDAQEHMNDHDSPGGSAAQGAATSAQVSARVAAATGHQVLPAAHAQHAAACCTRAARAPGEVGPSRPRRCAAWRCHSATDEASSRALGGTSWLAGGMRTSSPTKK